MPPPDYWPDARRIPPDKISRLVETIRGARDELGLSNAALCREVRSLIEAHNRVSGREPVHLKKLPGEWAYGDQGKYELEAIKKGTRKYIVGYLAWLCLRNEKDARAFYEEIKLPFRPNTQDPSTLGEEDAFAEASGKDEFLVYEIAFLWYGTTPPPAQLHESEMTPEIEQMKSLLHTAIDLEMLSALHFQAPAGGYARLVPREEIQRFAQEIGILPRFLFPNKQPSSGDTSAKLAKLAADLDELLLQLPKAVTDWVEEYARNEWAIYEAAFLWHDFAPPPVAVHERVMTEPMRQTKQMLHDAANANTLASTVGFGVTMRNAMVYGTRRVSRPELRRFATSIGQRPRFLFPEDDE